jgi:hypothetical protein
MSSGNYVVGQTSKIVMYAGKTTPNAEVIIKGLNKMTLPLGWTADFTSIAEFGVPVDIQVASGLKYDSISVSGNFTVKDPTQAIIRRASLNATKITDMRFYLDACHFAALDLISNPDGYYQIGSCTPPSGEKSGVYSFGFDISPGGASTLFENHRVGLGCTITKTGNIVSLTVDSGWVAAGFKPGQILIIDHLTASIDPLYLKINTVSDTVIACVDAVGDYATVPASTSSIAATAIHSGEAMVFDDSLVTC